MELARRSSGDAPTCIERTLRASGQHFEISDEDIARLILTDGGYDDVVLNYTGCGHYLLTLHEVEQGLCSWVSQASEAQDVCSLVQFWIIAAYRLGYGSLYAPVLDAYDRFVSFLEFSTACIPQCSVLDNYMILGTRHRFLEDRRYELTLALLTASVVGGGDQKCDTMFCGFHQSYTCPNDKMFERDWSVATGVQVDDGAVELRSLFSPIFQRSLKAESMSMVKFEVGRYLEPAVMMRGSAPCRRTTPSVSWTERFGMRMSSVGFENSSMDTCCYICREARDDNRGLGIAI